MTGDLAFALTAGTLAAVNPCGFAMLPAYVVLFASKSGAPTPLTALRRSATAALMMTLGFVTVFGAVGVVLTPVASSIQRWAPYLTVVIGVVLCGVGIAMLTGRKLSLPLPGLRARAGGPASGLFPMYLYGLTYATTSLGCSLGPFLVVVGSTLRHGDIGTGLASYLAYAAGMGLVVGVAGSAAVLAQRSGTRRAPRFRRLAASVGAVLVTLVGCYLAWYGIYEMRLRSGADVDDPIIRGAAGLQHSLAGWIDHAGPLGLTAVLLVMTLAVTLVSVPLRRGRRRFPERTFVD
jgi:cytochrome c biogenesis protein CcdA